jgi:nucleoside-diphosphate kinase
LSPAGILAAIGDEPRAGPALLERGAGPALLERGAGPALLERGAGPALLERGAGAGADRQCLLDLPEGVASGPCTVGPRRCSIGIDLLRSDGASYNKRSFVSITEHPMGTERTLSIIKPDAIAKDVIGQIYDRFERAGLRIVAAKMVHLDRARAEAFYAVHRERPFFGELVDFMTSGPVMVQVLEGEGAIDRHREVMGATNPAEAAPGTIRADFACEITENAVHGSDGPDTAASEITFFFSVEEICPRTR